MEADLARELGVSRGPLREAVRALSLMGVLEAEAAGEGAADPHAFVEADIRFHDLVATASANPVLASLVHACAGRTARARVWRVVSDEGAVARTLEEHRRSCARWRRTTRTGRGCGWATTCWRWRASSPVPGRRTPARWGDPGLPPRRACAGQGPPVRTGGQPERAVRVNTGAEGADPHRDVPMVPGWVTLPSGRRGCRR
ncbi:FCD domain-containing protein [Kineococcus arenarius]|uniref:FCD domain-containing protein n=1 Tax=unclassified Kineococcus TaxID=2621656 RepID=UPI003D7E5C33